MDRGVRFDPVNVPVVVVEPATEVAQRVTGPTPAVDTTEVRADWARTNTPMTYPGEANAGKTWGPYGDDIAGWALDNVPALLDALDAATAKLTEIEALHAEMVGRDRMALMHPGDVAERLAVILGRQS